MNCQHAGCKCQVAQSQEYCSDYCRGRSVKGTRRTHVTVGTPPAPSPSITGEPGSGRHRRGD
jgi:hypothetical protein